MIENILKFYYNFADFNLKNKNESYIINFHNIIYYFFPIRNTKEEIKDIYELYDEIHKYDEQTSEIILNKFKEITTTINNQEYILVKIGKKNINTNNKIINYQKKYNSLYRTQWGLLWAKKIDYLEYQRIHIKGNYKILDKYFDFFVGMTECAIALFNNEITKYNDLPITIQHKRYNEYFYDNPINIIIDYRVRDISELIKYKYFNNQIDINSINEMLEQFHLKEGENVLLFSRLLFPTFYFDLYNNIVNNDKKENSAEGYIEKFENYCLFLKKIGELKYFKDVKENFKWLK